MATEMVWHNDNHAIHLRVNRSEVEIVQVDCPDEDSGSCQIDENGCVVRYFIDRFGFDCNAGSCPASEKIQICWTLGGNIRDIDACQLWFMPITDETFQAWVESRNQN
jgi:hypothetical protein